MQRRDFLKNTAMAASAVAAGSSVLYGAEAAAASAASAPAVAARPMVKKSLKWGMVKEDLSIMDKFKLLKDLGYDGVELDSPDKLDMKEVLAARDKTGLELPGTVNSMHWKLPLSDPDPKKREECVKSIEKALHDTKQYGGTTVLVVPGVVNANVTYAEAYERSQAEIRKLLPVAEKTGVKIAFENVWNQFLISPLEAARYVDEFKHPMVGWYFDVGNVLRYGYPVSWIEALDKRILKLDLKEFSFKKQNDLGLWKGFDVEFMEGDCNWAEVNKALQKDRLLRLGIGRGFRRRPQTFINYP
ncbi:sugar phosphate isomerase/epimerase family protein [Dyadobacter fermentans]|uniref:Xylose isomerase domain protein TIM barrel n=1 Tax=Dyadobacter fermentans (strain ATCC 700827 / DSM 18053 / CIP 107007 / KCTC 52180 / NS114) TaxID=471854 RepID=C6W4I6_DYAFD|nr:sugar phosphate isomerase/epimerase family protein [Dyadobacter fermentans]ACT94087.1 Xylose isomerase domain protein TIM barrel [Dyadobacter fermentans DSM 18053]